MSRIHRILHNIFFMYVLCHVCIYVIFVIFEYLFIGLIFISYMSCFPFLVLYLLIKFMLNDTHEMHQHQWFIIVVYFVHVFHCTNFIFLQEMFKCFSLPFPSFMTMLICTQSHGSAKHWWHNSASMHGYILTSTKRSFLGTLFSYDSKHLHVI